jgi:NDP-sugar pyrophosphorylase family protein
MEAVSIVTEGFGRRLNPRTETWSKPRLETATSPIMVWR